MMLFLMAPDGNAQNVRIVVLGSSTAAGVGASSPSKGWVALMQARFRRNTTDGLDTTVTNLAVGGYTTYRGQPTGFVPPAFRPEPDVERNITRALQESPDYVFVNYPSNDVANAYSQDETMANYQRILNTTSSNTQVFFLTPQPRTEFNSSQDAQLLDQKGRMETGFPGKTINVFDPLRWRTSADPALQYEMDPLYRPDGDAIHPNDAGHQVILEQVLNAAFASLLPVKLKNLRASLNVDRVDLSWETSSEQNSKKFVVERSPDGRTFTALGEVAAKGNSSTLSRYSFTDRTALAPKMIYRLRIIDKDNSFEFSTMVTVTRPTSGIEKIYPVPAQSELNIQLHAAHAEKIEVDLLDINGRQYAHFTKALAKGPQTIPIPVASLPRGSYTLRILRGNSTSSYPFLKQ